jgi:hypothetical protein
MATSSSQPYIAKLGFQDQDRQSARHGLACEYLLERIVEIEMLDQLASYTLTHVDYSRNPFVKTDIYLSDVETHNAIDKTWEIIRSTPRLNVPISSRGFLKGFADVLVPILQYNVSLKGDISICQGHELILGEVKICKEPAEVVLQQINYYLDSIANLNSYTTIKACYVLTDYDPSHLQSLVAGTNIKVFRIGRSFIKWFNVRPTLKTPEL